MTTRTGTATKRQRTASGANNYATAPALTLQELNAHLFENFHGPRFERAAKDYATKYALVLLGSDPTKATHWGVRSVEGKTYLPNGEGCLCEDCQHAVKRANDRLEAAGGRRWLRCKHCFLRDRLLNDLWAGEVAA